LFTLAVFTDALGLVLFWAASADPSSKQVPRIKLVNVFISISFPGAIQLPLIWLDARGY
jgi:hypothetical protein